MSTKSKRRASRRTTPEQVILGEIMGALLSAITFGALEAEADEHDEASAQAAQAAQPAQPAQAA